MLKPTAVHPGLLPWSPWKKSFFVLLGQQSDLDQVETMLRAPDAYADPRIHFALNCASIGCPMLRQEAYVWTHLDAQLDDAMRHFLSDLNDILRAGPGPLEKQPKSSP